MSKSDMPPEVSASLDRPALYRAARWLVIIMSVLLALAFVAVVWGFIRQGRILMESRAARAAAQPVTTPASTPAQGVILLPPGAKIVSSAIQDGRLVLRLQTPQGEEMRIIDLTSGKLVQTIKTQP